MEVTNRFDLITSLDVLKIVFWLCFQATIVTIMTNSISYVMLVIPASVTRFYRLISPRILRLHTFMFSYSPFAFFSLNSLIPTYFFISRLLINLSTELIDLEQMCGASARRSHLTDTTAGHTRALCAGKRAYN